MIIQNTNYNYATEIADKDKDQLKDLEKENHSEDISEELDGNYKGVFNGEVKTNGINLKVLDQSEESPETFEHEESNHIIENVKKSDIDELQRKDKVGKSEGSQESLEEEANESLDEDKREKPDITEGEKSENMAMEIKESDEAAEDELNESLQKIKTYLRKWKKKLTKEI